MEMLAPLFDQATRMNDIEGSDNLLFPKRFSKKHPRIASMVEGAVLGAALTKPSSTPGEAISNVAQAVLGIPGFKKNKQMQKILAPLGMMKQGLEMQKLESGIGLDIARAEKLGRPDVPEDEDPFVKYFERPGGVFGVTPEGEGQQVPGIPGKPPTTSAGTDIERFIAKRNAERAAETPPRGPMNTTEEAAYRAQLRGQGAYVSGLEGARGREIITGPIRDRNELLRTEQGLANKEVGILEKMDDFDYMMENPEANEGDRAEALERLRELRANYFVHLRMGGTLSWEDFKFQRPSTGGGGNPFRPDQPR
jgi:hypothetical protein